MFAKSNRVNKNNTFGPGPIAILLIGPLITTNNQMFGRAGEKLQG